MAVLPDVLPPALVRGGRPRGPGRRELPLTSTPVARLAAALELDRELRVRAAPEVRAIPGGVVVRYPELDSVYHFNAVLLAAPLAAEIDAEAIVALADRWLDGLEHRRVVIDDAPAGERLASSLIDRGWERARTEFMAFGGDPGDGIEDPRAREVTDDELEGLQRTSYEHDRDLPKLSGLPARLVAAQSALRAATPARGFGAGEDGGLQAMCTLFLDSASSGGRVAMVEEVATLPDYRERGLAKAVVSAATRAATAWDADLILVPADADDWPQLLYAKLGFSPIGRQVSFTLRHARPHGSVSGAV